MPQQLATSVENNFTKGLVTDSTGLNFPENAAIDTDNCTYTLVGDVTRRLGIDRESSYRFADVSRINKAVSTFKWDNAGGDGVTQIVVEQIGSVLVFYKSSSATTTSPLSQQVLASTVNLTSFTAQFSTFDPTVECQYASGNGYLFVYHPSCDPLYCTYSAGTITPNPITLKIRDFTGIPDNLTPNTRPIVFSPEHYYNLTNQGWTAGNPWFATSATPQTITTGFTGPLTFIITAGLAIVNGDVVLCQGSATFAGQPAGNVVMSGTVTAYAGTSLTLNITSATVTSAVPTNIYDNWSLNPVNHGYISTWGTVTGTFPSNSDVWWYFKNASNVFDPATTLANVTLGISNAPRGHFVLSLFAQDRSSISGTAGITTVSTSKRPSTGCWFQGRVWYTGVNAQFTAAGDAPFTSWSESIYFSQIVQTTADLGNCFQINDPTSETLFDLLPTDGGVITIQDCGSIYKLFPLQNALLVFAANGVWYITGSQGIGFSANDYTVVKLSSVKSISSTSIVDVKGLPYFWNEEGIYAVEPAKQGTSLLSSPLHVNPLEVNPITVGVIQSFYEQIPIASKRYVRGAYDPIDYKIQWIYRSTPETSTTDRYQFDRMLNYNTYNKAFFPYTIGTLDTINSILYVSYPGSANTPAPALKYACSTATLGTYLNTFAEEYDTRYVDWHSVGGVNYESFFITGYKLRGQAIKKFQPQYVRIGLKTNGVYSGYKIQGIWDYANDPNTGRWSTLQFIEIPAAGYDTVFKRHKIRGHGYSLQFKVVSVDNKPFDIQGWSVVDTVNQGT